MRQGRSQEGRQTLAMKTISWMWAMGAHVLPQIWVKPNTWHSAHAKTRAASHFPTVGKLTSVVGLLRGVVRSCPEMSSCNVLNYILLPLWNAEATR